MELNPGEVKNAKVNLFKHNLILSYMLKSNRF